MMKRILAAAAIALAATGGAVAQSGQYGAGQVSGNSSAASRSAGPENVTAILDRALGSTRGSILERGASGWTIVGPGTTGRPWVSNGAGADPAYQVLGVAGGGTNCSAASGTCLDNITGFASTGYLKRTGAGAYSFQASPIPVGDGGTGITSGTSGGVLCFTGASTIASSTALAANSLLLGGGAGICPNSTTTGIGVVSALGANVGSAGAFVVNGGALGSPSSVGTMPAFTLGDTVTGGGQSITGAGSITSADHVITSASANAVAVGRQGSTNPVLQVDASTASVATGIKVKGAAAASGVAISAITSGANENLTIDAAGSGTITLNGTATGNITTPRVVTITNTTAATSTGNGALVVSGGMGVIGDFFAATVTMKGSNAGLSIDDRSNGSAHGWVWYAQGNSMSLFSSNGSTNRLSIADSDGAVSVLSTTAATGTGAAALTSAGGIGAAGSLFSGGFLATKAPVTVTGTSGTIGSIDGTTIFNPSGTFTATLPSAAANPGRWLYVKTIAAQTVNSASSNIVPLSGGAAGTALLSATAGKWAILQSDATNWNIMASN